MNVGEGQVFIDELHPIAVAGHKPLQFPLGLTTEGALKIRKFDEGNFGVGVAFDGGVGDHTLRIGAHLESELGLELGSPFRLDSVVFADGFENGFRIVVENFEHFRFKVRADGDLGDRLRGPWGNR